jgi:hypothetical protein
VIVGSWSRRTTSDEQVAALVKAGLGRFGAEHAASEGWLPDVTDQSKIKDPAHPCAGAVPLRHSHFFTADGLFGCRDADGHQVDDGTYRLVDDHTIVIAKEFGEVTFRYTITGGTALVLDPQMPACATDGCFAAQWAVAMSYPGLTWTRS